MERAVRGGDDHRALELPNRPNARFRYWRHRRGERVHHEAFGGHRELLGSYRGQWSVPSGLYEFPHPYVERCTPLEEPTLENVNLR